MEKLAPSNLLREKFLQSLAPELRESTQLYWQRLEEGDNFSASGAKALLEDDSSLCEQTLRVMACSGFIAEALIRAPDLLLHVYRERNLEKADYSARLGSALAALRVGGDQAGIDHLKKVIRCFHRREFIIILWRDLCGYLDVHQVCRQMSDLADACLQQALELLDCWSRSQWGIPQHNGEAQQLVVIGMGKLGANELNVSSDIDLIFAYPESGETVGARDSISNQQYFTRLGQRLIDVLDTVTSEGFVFRVDMRLRPYGSEGALVLNFDALEDYYQNQGRDWERYAWIKARAVAGDLDRGRALIRRLTPFVYRRYLDFAMFESLRDMKIQINKQARRGKLDDDIKLGPGGIREVEFTVQAMQLVHGGRDRRLRTASIKQALDELQQAGYLPRATTAELLEAYEFLRCLEHRIQAQDNQQTQRLPDGNRNRARVALAMNAGDWQLMIETLDQHRSCVASHFRSVLHMESDAAEQTQSVRDWLPVWKFELSMEEVLRILTREGYEKPQESYAVLDGFRRDRKLLVLTPESRRRLDLFMPLLLDAVSQSSRPSLCLERVMPLVEAVSRRTAYLVLLMENPRALSQLIVFCTASPLISEYLAKFPVLLDELLDVLDVPPDKSVLADELRLQLLRIDAASFEEQLECLRYFKQSHLLQVAAAEVSGKMPLMKVSDYLTFTAELILDAVLSLAWQYLITRHGYPRHIDGSFGNPDFAIIGYGKLGGLELAYNSDLDLVFLHRGDLQAETVTDRQDQQAINSRAFYIKLAQRIMVILGTYTMSGKLYKIDTRLRPSGESGMLVSSLESFIDYQQNSAWTWEHQALVRARGVAGNRALLQAFTEARKLVLTAKRDVGTTAAEVVTMRERMRRELVSSSSDVSEQLAFRVKHGPGGIVDIEFLVQYLVLAHARECPGLVTWTDNYRILEAAADYELLRPGEVRILIEAYLELRAVSHRLALHQEGAPESARVLDCQSRVMTVWNTTFQPALGTAAAAAEHP